MTADVLKSMSSAFYPQLHLNGEAFEGQVSKYLSFVALSILAGQLKVLVNNLY